MFKFMDVVNYKPCNSMFIVLHQEDDFILIGSMDKIFKKMNTNIIRIGKADFESVEFYMHINENRELEDYCKAVAEKFLEYCKVNNLQQYIYRFQYEYETGTIKEEKLTVIDTVPFAFYVDYALKHHGSVDWHDIKIGEEREISEEFFHTYNKNFNMKIKVVREDNTKTTVYCPSLNYISPISTSCSKRASSVYSIDENFGKNLACVIIEHINNKNNKLRNDMKSMQTEIEKNEKNAENLASVYNI